MRKQLIFLLIAMTAVVSACSQETSDKNATAQENDNFVFVKGGTFTNTKSNYYGANVTIPNFYIGKYEVTQQEWMDVMGSNPSQFKGSNFPVETVSWYDAIEYCNKRSNQEGLQPYYNIDKNTIDPNNKSDIDHIKWAVTINPGANGYRLPTEAEWEYAGGGGQASKSYTYSGSDKADEVAWYWRNAGNNYLSGDWYWPVIENNRNRTKTGGIKKPNELGLYDMSGNVREWVWNWYGDGNSDRNSGTHRVVKGGGWVGDVSNCAISFRGRFDANGLGPDQGFRVIRGE